MKLDAVAKGSRRLREIFLRTALAGCFSWAAASAWAAVEPGPCAANAASRQMDFWVGDWTVTYPGMAGSAASRVSLALDDCALLENWDGGKGHKGQNLLAYSSDDKKWHGMFLDNQGRVHIFEGTVAPGSAEFLGSGRGPHGEAVLNRIKVVRLTANKVEQSWEKSTDNGITWTMEFYGDYTRKESVSRWRGVGR